MSGAKRREIYYTPKSVFLVLDGMDVGQLGSVFSAAKFVSKPITFQKCTPSSSFVFVFDPGVFDPLTPRAAY